MSDAKYLEDVLATQTFAEGDTELKALRAKRDEVEKVLRAGFPDSTPTIKYGGSHAKGTMIKESYDLDVVCYFDRDDDGAGDTLEAIFDNVRDVLAQKYAVTPKTSALRIEEGQGTERTYTHVDVVPGRFIEEDSDDVWLYQNGAEKCRLRTNTKTHVHHIHDSGVRPAIRLAKLWRECYGHFDFKTFVLELLIVDVLKTQKTKSLDTQLITFWETVRDSIDTLTVEDPANTNNNLSIYLTDRRDVLREWAKMTLVDLEDRGWQAIFALPEEKKKQQELIARLPSIRPQGTKPWSAR